MLIENYLMQNCPYNIQEATSLRHSTFIIYLQNETEDMSDIHEESFESFGMNTINGNNN